MKIDLTIITNEYIKKLSSVVDIVYYGQYKLSRVDLGINGQSLFLVELKDTDNNTTIINWFQFVVLNLAPACFEYLKDEDDEDYDYVDWATDNIMPHIYEYQPKEIINTLYNLVYNN